MDTVPRRRMDPRTLTPRALELARQRLDQALEERPEDVRLLMMRARADERQGRYGEAAAYFERAAHICRRDEDRAGEGEAQLDCGSALSRAGHDEAALAAYDRAIACFDSIEQPARAVEARTQWVRHQLAHRRFEDALQQLTSMLPRLDSLDDAATQRWAHEQLIHLNRREGKLEEALEHARTCVRLAAHAQDPSEFGLHLRELGALHDELGNTHKAMSYFGRALPYLRQGRRRSPAHDTLIRLSELTAEKGEAVEYLEEALEIAERGSPRDKGRVRVLLADQLMEESPERALELLQVAVAQLREAGDPKRSAPAWLKLAVLQARLGDPDEARVSQQRARELFAMVGDEDGANQADLLLDLL